MLPDPLPVDAAPDAPIDAAPPVAQPSVRELLATSRQSHLQYHQFLPRMAAVNGSLPQLQAGDSESALKALKIAAAARAQAELIDPQHTDASWSDDAQTTPHQETLVFYLQQLAK